MSPHVPGEQAEASQKEGLGVRLLALGRAQLQPLPVGGFVLCRVTPPLQRELLSEAVLSGEKGTVEPQAPSARGGQGGAKGRPAAPERRLRSPSWEPSWVVAVVLLPIKNRVGYKQLPSDSRFQKLPLSLPLSNGQCVDCGSGDLREGVIQHGTPE